MMTDGWGIRELESDEFAELTKLEARCFDANPWGEARLQASLHDPATTITVCAREDLIIGFCIWRVFPPDAEILLIAVSPKERNNGVAKALIQNVNEIAAGRSVTTVFLEVSACNHPAIACYKRSGFVESGVRGGYYNNGADALIMACKIQ